MLAIHRFLLLLILQLEGVVGMGFEFLQGGIVDLANPLAGQPKPVSDLTAAVALKVDGKEDLLAPVVEKLSGEVEQLYHAL